jgi:hypothetical protein
MDSQSFLQKIPAMHYLNELWATFSNNTHFDAVVRRLALDPAISTTQLCTITTAFIGFSPKTHDRSALLRRIVAAGNAVIS